MKPVAERRDPRTFPPRFGLVLACLPVLLLASLVASAPARAERGDRDRPVQIEANAMQLDQARQVAVYEGNVVLTQGTLLLTADRLAIRQDAAGFQSGEATGRPVRFRQKVDGQDLYVEGQANRIEYDARAETVRLIGEARLKRGQDDLRGHLITYNTASQVYQAQGAGPGSEGGRVRAVIQPRSRTGEGSGTP